MTLLAFSLMLEVAPTCPTCLTSCFLTVSKPASLLQPATPAICSHAIPVLALHPCLLTSFSSALITPITSSVSILNFLFTDPYCIKDSNLFAYSPLSLFISLLLSLLSVFYFKFPLYMALCQCFFSLIYYITFHHTIAFSFNC